MQVRLNQSSGLSFGSNQSLSFRAALPLQSFHFTSRFIRCSTSKFDAKKTWTPRSLFAWTREHFKTTIVYRHRLATEMYVASTLGISRLDLFLRCDRPIEKRKLAHYEKGLERLDKGEPLASLTGNMSFHDIVLAVGRKTFIPKPETEHLVEAAIEVLKFLNKKTAVSPSLKVLDICTGVGNIPIAIMRALSDFQLEINGTDISTAALNAAGQNVKREGYEARIHLFKGDLFHCPELIPEQYDVIVSNPPYKTTEAAKSYAQGGEPRAAYDGGKDGLDAIRKILAEAPRFLKPNGFLLIEIGEGQEEAVIELGKKNPYWKFQRVLEKTRGVSSVFVASPQAHVPSFMEEVKTSQGTPLIHEKGKTWFAAKVVRVLARELKTRIKELEAILPKAQSLESEQTRVDISSKIESLIRDAKKQIDLEIACKTLDPFEIMRLHMQAVEICDLLDAADAQLGRQRHFTKYFNLSFLRKKEHQYGTIFDFAAIFILMDVLEPLTAEFNQQIERIERSRVQELFNLDDLRKLSRQAVDCIDISKSFTAKKRNKYGERLSHTVPSNWSNILYGLGISISQIEEKLAALRTIKIV